MTTACKIFHDWDKWTDQGTVDAYDVDKRLVGQVLTLRRTCRRCGEIDLKLKTVLTGRS